MSRRVAVMIAAAPFAVGALAMSGASRVQPQPAGAGGAGDRGRDRVYTAWVPPGTYTALVVCSSGEDRRWTVSLMSNGVNVPLVVRPGENVIVPFAGGWTVNPGDEARVVSRLVPFDDAARFNLVGQPSEYVLSAWGITSAGPVEFVYRDTK